MACEFDRCGLRDRLKYSSEYMGSLYNFCLFVEHAGQFMRGSGGIAIDFDDLVRTLLIRLGHLDDFGACCRSTASHLLNRLLFRLHNIRKRRIPWIVEALLCSDNARHIEFYRLTSALDLLFRA